MSVPNLPENWTTEFISSVTQIAGESETIENKITSMKLAPKSSSQVIMRITASPATPVDTLICSDGTNSVSCEFDTDHKLEKCFETDSPETEVENCEFAGNNFSCGSTNYDQSCFWSKSFEISPLAESDSFSNSDPGSESDNSQIDFKVDPNDSNQNDLLYCATGILDTDGTVKSGYEESKVWQAGVLDFCKLE